MNKSKGSKRIEKYSFSFASKIKIIHQSRWFLILGSDSCRFSAVAQAQLGESNGRRNSGYDGAASSTMINEPTEMNSSPSPNPRMTSAPSSSTSSSPPPSARPGSAAATSIQGSQTDRKKNGNGAGKQEFKRLKSAGSLLPLQLGRTPNVLSDTPSTSKKDKKNASSGSKFTIYKANKASKKKREKSTAKKERKATKTLAIVLGKKFHGFCFRLYLTRLTNCRYYS